MHKVPRAFKHPFMTKTGSAGKSDPGYSCNSTGLPYRLYIVKFRVFFFQFIEHDFASHEGTQHVLSDVIQQK